MHTMEEQPITVQSDAELTTRQEEELASVNGGTGFGPIFKEMFTVAGNRRRMFLSVALMCAQQVRIRIVLPI